MHYRGLNYIGTIISTLVQIILSLALTCLLAPICLPILLINELLRLIISFLLYIQFGSKIALVPDGADNIWHYKKYGNTRMCLIARFSDDPFTSQDLDLYRTNFETQVINKVLPDGTTPYVKLTKTFIRKFGYDCFLKNEFDIASHVKIYNPQKVDTDGEDYITEEEFLNTILPELNQDMDGTKPQWEEIIVPRVKCNDKDSLQSVRCFRYHHGYMDGVSATLMFANCMYDKPPEKFPYIVDPMAKLKVSRVKQFLFNLVCVLTTTFTIVKILYLAGKLKGRFVVPKFTGQRHFGWSEKLDASLLRRVRSVMKVSAPTVLASAAGSALKKLSDKYPKGDSWKEKDVILGMINALLPYRDIRPKNQFTLTHFSLPIGDMSWCQRLAKVDEEMRKLPSDPAYSCMFFMFRFFGRFPSFIVQTLMEDGGNPISFSNVPMSNEEVRFWGSQINEVGGWPPLVTNTGMGIIIMRYESKIRFLTVADEACLSKTEMEYFLSQVTTEIRQMAEECSQNLVVNVEQDCDKIVKA